MHQIILTLIANQAINGKRYAKRSRISNSCKIANLSTFGSPDSISIQEFRVQRMRAPLLAFLLNLPTLPLAASEVSAQANNDYTDIIIASQYFQVRESFESTKGLPGIKNGFYKFK